MTKNTYYIYIKSHSEAPDYEDEVVAQTKKGAIKLFLKKINWGNEDPWDETMIEPYVEKLN